MIVEYAARYLDENVIDGDYDTWFSRTPLGQQMKLIKVEHDGDIIRFTVGKKVN